MKELSRGECHDCAPKAWRDIASVSGDYDLDATIAHRNNSDLPHRLAMYRSGPRTAYTGYHGYSGDN